MSKYVFGFFAFCAMAMAAFFDIISVAGSYTGVLIESLICAACSAACVIAMATRRDSSWISWVLGALLLIVDAMIVLNAVRRLGLL